MRQLFLFLYLLQIGFVSYSQLGQNPNQKWLQSEHNGITVIHDSSHVAEAKYILEVTNHLQENLKTLIAPIRPINVFYQNYNASFNGFVSTFPWRSEYYGINPPNNRILGSSDWLQSLTIHEMRHAIQFSYAREQWPIKLGYLLGGDLGWGSFTGLVLPNWFFEGDAVWFETAITNNGRGRTPSFMNLSRAYANENFKFKYNRAKFDSYKLPTPSRYEMGYLLMSHLREKYGNETVDKIVSETTAYEGLFFPIRKAITYHTRNSIDQVYAEMLDNWNTKMDSLHQNRNLSLSHSITQHRKKEISNYRFFKIDPVTNKKYFIQSGWNNNLAIREYISSTKNKIVIPVGSSPNRNYDVKNDIFVWSEWQPHLRRENLGTYNLNIFDKKTKEKRRIENDKNYYNPSFDLQSDEIVVGYSGQSLKNGVEIFDLKTLKSQLNVHHPDNGLMLYPVKNGNEIYTIVKNHGELSIENYDIEKEKWSILYPKTRAIIENLSLSDSSLYFSASFEGIDEIYKMSIDGGKAIKIAGTKNGIYEPTLDTLGNLWVSQFTAQGMEIATINAEHFISDTLTEQPIDSSYLYSSSFDEEIVFDDKNIESIKVNTSGYPKGKKLFNLHSWSPEMDLESISLNLYSNNILDDFEATAGASYAFIDNEWSVGAGLEYGGTFAVLGYDYGFTPEVSFVYQDIFADSLVFNRFLYRQHKQSLSASFPLNLSKGSYWNTNLNLKGQLNLYTVDHLNSKSLLGSTIEASFFHFTPTPKRNLITKWGIFSNFQYALGLGNGNRQFQGSLTLNFPGFYSSHGIALTGAYFNRMVDENNPLRTENKFVGSRVINFTSSNKTTVSRLSYYYPLFYPEFTILNGLFLKRVYGIAYGEWQRNKYELEIGASLDDDFLSWGHDVVLEVSFMDNFEIEVGFRTSWYRRKLTNEVTNENSFFLNFPFGNFSSAHFDTRTLNVLHF